MSLVRSHSIRPLKRDTLKDKMATNDAANDWGLKCLRYEIRDISPPPGVRAAMEMQAEAERKIRAQVLELEASLRIAEQYTQAFSNIAKEGTTLLLPTNASDPASMVAQALNIYKNLSSKNAGSQSS
ncbi:hypothetical protein K7X08_003851 [Anisodus acutangulus]|uniref:STML2-like C-terminal extension domain-containing protein n=1 Tax=Anisodus acutangulus TaxID=402998 RepID=A0A9Q1MGH0_9SOLA|nr:hypothetical protein K7X08_003851 [Anisodus acutangulus]